MLRLWATAPFSHFLLLKNFLRHDIDGRYAGSFAGLFWTIVAPVANILLYMFVFSAIMRVRIPEEEAGTSSFAIYMLCGLIPWLAFAEALGRAPVLLLEKENLIKKIVFPVEVLPFVALGGPLVLNGIGFGIFIAILMALGYAGPSWALVPVIVLIQALFTSGLVAILAALGVFLRDLQHVIGLVTSAWFFLTPIVYPLSQVPEQLRPWFWLNPMHPIIGLYRDALLGHQLNGYMLGYGAVVGTASFLLGGWVFMKLKDTFSDVL